MTQVRNRRTVGRVKLWVCALVLCLAACGEQAASPAETQAAAAKPPSRQLSLPEASRKFLVIETLVATESSGARSYFGRTAFRLRRIR